MILILKIIAACRLIVAGVDSEKNFGFGEGEQVNHKSLILTMIVNYKVKIIVGSWSSKFYIYFWLL